jgi:hypothetical protein
MKLFQYIRPSQLTRQTRCSKSLRFDYLYKDVNKTTSVANRGLLIHTEVSYKFKNKKYLEEKDEYFENKQDYDDMILEAKEYLDFIYSIENNKDKISIEEDINLKYLYNSKYFKEKNGTADCVIRDNNKLTIIDLKTGAIPVQAKNNHQLYTYAYCILINENEKYDEIKLIIYQNNQMLNNVNEITLNKNELKSFIKNEIQDKLEQIELGDLNYKVGTHCKYCPNNSSCIALNNRVLMSYKNRDILNLDDKVELLKLKSSLLSMFSNIEEELIEKINKSEYKNSSLKITKTRAKRNWLFDDVVENRLKNKGLNPDDFKTKPTLLSPAQLEKKLKRMNIKLNLSDIYEKSIGNDKITFI